MAEFIKRKRRWRQSFYPLSSLAGGSGGLRGGKDTCGKLGGLLPLSSRVRVFLPRSIARVTFGAEKGGKANKKLSSYRRRYNRCQARIFRIGARGGEEKKPPPSIAFLALVGDYTLQQWSREKKV